MSEDFDDDDLDAQFDDADDSAEALVWQLLLLINPGDEEAALQQFNDYREAAGELDADALDPIAVLGRVIDWRAGFMVEVSDLRTLMQVLEELAARWNIAIDWGGDADDDGFLDDLDAAEVCSIAGDRLAESGYTLWTWETDEDTCAGLMTRTRDREALRAIAAALGIHIRRGYVN